MMNPRGFVAEGSGEELRAISFDSRAAKASYLISLSQNFKSETGQDAGGRCAAFRKR